MSVPLTTLPALPGASAVLSGWGRVTSSVARLVEVDAGRVAAGQLALLATAEEPRGRIARGAGRSYGDAALNAGGVVLDCRPLRGVRAFDAEAGTVTVDAGTTIEDILRAVVPHGWFPAVVPGTRFVTVGGAIASDVHGKNHHRDGAFGAHLVGIELVTADGETHTTGPDREPELFWATVGGLGLTGLIVRATLRLIRVASAMFEVEQRRQPGLDAMLAAMDAETHRYAVGWLDLTARGRALGRGIVIRGDHAPAASGAAAEPLRYRPRRSWPVGVPLPGALFSRPVVRAVNEAVYRRPLPGSGIASIDAFLFPLDRLAGWNRWYGARGFVQYQCVVPAGREDALREVTRRLAESPTPVTLGMLKRLGPAGPGPLSFPLDGWTLAADLPVGDARLGGLLRSLDALVAEAGGRVYLAKDGRLQPDILAAMYPRLQEWRAVRERVDPEHRFTSDLARRLGL